MNKKLIRLTESDLHNIVKESVKIVIEEMEGNIITCFGSSEAISQRGYAGSGSLLGDGVIYLRVGHAPNNSIYSNNLITVNVDISNFYQAKDAFEAMDVAKNNKGKYSGILYHSRHDGYVCAVFDKSSIVNIVKESVSNILRERQEPKYNIGDYVRVHFKGEYSPITMRITRIKPIKGYGFYYDGVSNGQWHGAMEDDIDFKYDVIDDGNGGEILSPPQGVISGIDQV